MPLRTDAVERAAQARIVDRLEQVVERMRLERVDREAVEGRHEDDHRHAFLRHAREHVQTREPRHLDIEEHEVRRVLLDGRERSTTVGALGDDLDIVLVAQADLESASRELLVVDDDGADGHGCTACSYGRVISMRKPGCAVRRS